MSQEIINKAAKIIAANTVKNGTFNGEICTLTLIDEDSYPTASVITPAKSDGLNWLTFGTLLNDNRAKRAKNCNRASVSWGTAEYCVNLVGDIEVITDQQVKSEMWYDGLAHHFPDGETDLNYCVLKFTTRRYKLFVDWQDVAGRME